MLCHKSIHMPFVKPCPVAAGLGILETGFDEESMVKYCLGLEQAGRMPGAKPWPEAEGEAKIEKRTKKNCMRVGDLFRNLDIESMLSERMGT